jgi:two-component system, NarL family, response regulator NreC
MNPGKVRVLVVDDHELVRQGVRMVFDGDPQVEVVGEADNADDALAAIRRERPDVVFMDISLRDASGIELTRRLRVTNPEVRVIILTFHEGEEYFLQALQAGAAGYVVKGSHSSDLRRALEAVREGGTFLTPNLATGLVSHYLEGRGAAAFQELTTREREVAEALIEGLSNQEIALKLDISVTTVQTHRSHIMEKLGVRNYGEFIRYAIRNGLITP